MHVSIHSIITYGDNAIKLSNYVNLMDFYTPEKLIIKNNCKTEPNAKFTSWSPVYNMT